MAAVANILFIIFDLLFSAGGSAGGRFLATQRNRMDVPTGEKHDAAVELEKFKKAMKKFTLHSVGVPAVRRDRNHHVRCKRSVVHADFKLKKKGGKK